jgi:3-hydroxybutyryl-CoA dehydrogenase
MNISIRALENQKQELLQKGFGNKAAVTWVEAGKKYSDVNADVYFDLAFNDMDYAHNEFIDDKPVFVHAVNCTCNEIGKINYIRLNAWNGFLSRTLTELVCSNEEFRKKAEDVFNVLEWRYTWVNDDYGFIAGRIVAMIINEACYALEDNVSTKDQIDIAMKLGTSYPYGPFEWGEKIGLKNIVCLLEKLSQKDSRYTISALLVHKSQHS